MAGHSKWAGIKHKKAIVDARRGKLFTKLARAITVAAKEGGGDPDGNPSLALAIQKARDASMPKDNIERAVAKGTGEGADADAYEAVMYEGYGPGGVAVLVEALTDNRNRTGSEMRHAFTKHGGSLGEPGSVAYLFDKKGVVVVDGERYSEDDLMVAIDAGAEDIAVDDDVYEVICEPADLAEGPPGPGRRGRRGRGRAGRAAAEEPRPARRGRRGQADEADRRARGPGRHRRRARELRRARGRARTRRRLSVYAPDNRRVNGPVQGTLGIVTRSSWNPVAIFLVALMALGSVLMWIGVPLALVYIASKLSSSSNPTLGPILLVLLGLPIGFAIVGKGLGWLDRRHQAITRQGGGSQRTAPVDERRCAASAEDRRRRRARQGDDRLRRPRAGALRPLVLRVRRLLAGQLLAARPGRRPVADAESPACT